MRRSLVDPIPTTPPTSRQVSDRRLSIFRWLRAVYCPSNQIGHARETATAVALCPDRSGVTAAGLAHLAAMTGLDERTVQRHVQALTAAGLVIATPRRKHATRLQLVIPTPIYHSSQCLNLARAHARLADEIRRDLDEIGTETSTPRAEQNNADPVLEELIARHRAPAGGHAVGGNGAHAPNIERTRVLELGRTCGFPRISLSTGEMVLGEESMWSRFAAQANPDQLRRAEAVLRALMPAPEPTT